jgi:hypothetical protein
MKNFAASVSMARLIRAELKIAAFCWAWFKFASVHPSGQSRSVAT